MNKLLTYLIIFSGLLLIPIMEVMAQENPDVVVVTTEGSGNTRQAAINDALALAVSQVNGITISANENSNVTSADVSTSSSYESANVMAGRVDTQGKVKAKKRQYKEGSEVPEKDVAELEGNSSQSVQAATASAGAQRSNFQGTANVSNRGINTSTKGQIQSFKLISSSQTEAGYQVTVEASVFSAAARDRRVKSEQRESALAREKSRQASDKRRAAEARARAAADRRAAAEALAKAEEEKRLAEEARQKRIAEAKIEAQKKKDALREEIKNRKREQAMDDDW